MERKAREVIQNILYINLATVTSDGQPWNSPVYTAYDQDYNFYWTSWLENQHSKNIAHNGLVYAVIYNSQAKEGEGLGVYMQGRAEVLETLDEILFAITLLRGRTNTELIQADPSHYQDNFPGRVYRFMPESVWVNGDNDIEGNFIDIKHEIKLI